MADFASGFAQGAGAVNDIINTYYKAQYYREHIAALRQKRDDEGKLRARTQDYNNWMAKQAPGAPRDFDTYGRQLRSAQSRDPAIAAQPGSTPAGAAAPAAGTPSTPRVDPQAGGMEDDDPVYADSYAYGGQVQQRRPAVNPQMARQVYNRFANQNAPQQSSTPSSTPGDAPVPEAPAPAPAVEAPVPAVEAPVANVGAGVGEAGAGVGEAGAAVGEAGAAVGEAGAALGEGAGAAGAALGEGVGAAGAAVGEGAGAAGAAIGEGVAALGTAIGEAIPAIAAVAMLAEGGPVPSAEEADAATLPGQPRAPAVEDGAAPRPTRLAEAHEGGISGAIRGFYDYIGEALGGRPGAIDTPDAQGQRQALSRTMQQADPGAVSTQVRRAGMVPEGQPIPTMAWSDANALLTHHFMSSGNIEGLRHAQTYLEAARANGASRAAAMAVAAGQNNDTAGLAKALGRLNDFMPDGNDYTFTPTANGIQVSVRPERAGGQPETRMMTVEQAVNQAYALMDPEKQRAHLLAREHFEETKRNGESARATAAGHLALARSGDARAARAEGRTEEDRALERQHSAAQVELDQLPESATPEQRAAAQQKVDALRSRMGTGQRAAAITTDTAALNQSEASEQRRAGRVFVSSMTTAQEAAQSAEGLPEGDPGRAAADDAAATAQAAAVRAFGALNLTQAGQAATLMQKLETAGVSRQDRQQVGTYVDSLAQVGEAQAALRQAQTTRDPTKIQEAQATLAEAMATNRRALTGMSTSAVARLGALSQAQENAGNRGRGGAGGTGGAGGGDASTLGDRAKVEEAVTAALDALPADRRGSMAPADRASIRDVAVGIASNGGNRLAPAQAAEVAAGLHAGEIRVDPNSLVVKTLGGTEVVLSVAQHAQLLARQQAAPAAPERGSGARAVAGLASPPQTAVRELDRARAAPDLPARPTAAAAPPDPVAAAADEVRRRGARMSEAARDRLLRATAIQRNVPEAALRRAIRGPAITEGAR